VEEHSLAVAGQAKKFFNSIVILDVGIIWKHKNRCIFRAVFPTLWWLFRLLGRR
jgi:hypothetical protein